MAYTTINKSTDYFNTKLYTGNGSVRTETGVGFQPDLTWIKDRTGTNAHVWTDAVRGANYQIYSNLTNAQTNASGYLTAFASDGFTLGTDGAVNQNSSNYVSWNWLGGNGTSSNTNGSITSTVSANTTAGFSIVSYTGTGANATVGHGLGSTPKMIIAKQYSSNGGTEHWTVFHHTLDTNKNLYLNLTNAEDTPSPEIYREGSFTNDVFAIGAHDRINNNTVSYIAYCFAEKTGYSKFGSYTGTGNATESPFIYTGFKPSFVMFKRATTAGASWCVIDTVRQVSNTNTLEFPAANSNVAEATGNYQKDFLSNGFKMRSATDNFNKSGDTYIYMAFGQSLVGSNNVPCTAR